MKYDKRPVVLLTVSLLLLAIVGGCVRRTPHQRLGWKAEDFFKDARVISLCNAIERRDIAEIERLAKSGVNINAKGRGNMTPLLWAFPMGETVFKKMLDLGADPNVKTSGRVWPFPLYDTYSVMSTCANPTFVEGGIHNEYFRDVPMDNYLKLVLKHGGNPNIEDANGETPIFYMGGSNVSEKTHLLCDAGADLNHRKSCGATPLIERTTAPSYVLCLLKAGADYRMANDNGWDLVLILENLKTPQGPSGQAQSFSDRQVAQAKPVFDWLSNEGVNWKAAREALNSPETMQNLKNLPADYKHRPWLPQRPTLKKPDDKAKK
jgi:hypothetical protein